MIKYSPYFLGIALIFSVVFEKFIFNNVHLLLVCLFVFLLCINCFRSARYITFRKKKILILVLFGLIVEIIISMIIFQNLLIPVIGSIVYLFPILFWIFYYYNYMEHFCITQYIKFLVMITFILSCFAFYQRFVDISLFGIVSEIHEAYDIHNAYEFRVSSLMSSIQVFSFFLLIINVLFLENLQNVDYKNWFKILFIIVYFGAGICTGSKIYLVGIVSYILIKGFEIVKHKKINYKSIFLFLSLIVILFVIIVMYIEISNKIDFVYLNRLFLIFGDFNQFISEESYRLSKQFQIFSENIVNIIFGKGIGTSSVAATNFLKNITSFKRFTTESYFMTVWYEMGIIQFLLTIILFFQSYRKAKYINNISIKYTLLIIILGCIYSPAFESFQFLPIWGIILYPFFINAAKGELSYESSIT